MFVFFFSSRRRHTRLQGDWSSDVCSSDLREAVGELPPHVRLIRPDDDVDNVDLFRIVDAGVTIRGTVGLELPRLGVPALTAGGGGRAPRAGPPAGGRPRGAAAEGGRGGAADEAREAAAGRLG